jgi:hypothetical protein
MIAPRLPGYVVGVQACAPRRGRCQCRAFDGRLLTVVDSGGPRFIGGEDPRGLDDRLGDLPLFPPHPYDERQGAFLELAFTLVGHRLDIRLLRSPPDWVFY